MKLRYVALPLLALAACDHETAPPAGQAGEARNPKGKIDWDRPAGGQLHPGTLQGHQQSADGKIVLGPALNDTFQVTYDYPDYTGLPDKTEANYGEIRAVAGTEVKLKGELTRPVQKAEIKLDERPAAGASLLMEDGRQFFVWETTLTPGLDSRWTYELTDENNVTIAFPSVITALADLAPSITIETPAETEMELRPTERLPIVYTVREDYGIGAMAIKAKANGKEERTIRQPLPVKNPASENGVFNGTAILDLGTLRF